MHQNDEEREKKKQTLIRLAGKYVRETGKIPTFAMFKKSNLVVYYFGSWDNFLKACGLDFNVSVSIKKANLIKQCLALADKLGRTPYAKEFTRGLIYV